MIASRSDAAQLPRVSWRRDAKRSLAVLLDFLEARGLADPESRRRRIEEAIESLRYSPLRCQVVATKGRLTFRQLVVDGRFLVYYVYIPPRGVNSGGTLSIRAVKHAASQSPFLEVREALTEGQPLGVLSTHDRSDPAIA